MQYWPSLTLKGHQVRLLKSWSHHPSEFTKNRKNWNQSVAIKKSLAGTTGFKWSLFLKNTLFPILFTHKLFREVKANQRWSTHTFPKWTWPPWVLCPFSHRAEVLTDVSLNKAIFLELYYKVSWEIMSRFILKPHSLVSSGLFATTISCLGYHESAH